MPGPRLKVYDYVIASDESMEKPNHAGGGKKKKKKRDNEYGVSRGVDFKGVQNVLNFDFPATPQSYIHRVGRTARGHDAGVALSLVSAANDDKVLAETQEMLKGDANDESPLKPYAFKVRNHSTHWIGRSLGTRCSFALRLTRLLAPSHHLPPKMSAIDGLRYRVRDAIKGITKHSIRDARRKEIRIEILNSELLKQHFEENPRDAEVLRHDAGLANPRRIKTHLKHVPDYLVPKGTEAARGRKRKDTSKYHNSDAKKAKQKKQNNPLKVSKK